MQVKSKNIKSLSIIIIFAIFFLSPQIFQRSLIVANDWLFHMNRYYETSMQIQTGHYNYFQSLFGFNQSGRIINSMYGADFAYFAGAILSLVKSWFHFQLILNFLCFFSAGFSMYLLAKSARISENVSLFCGIIYMGTPLVIWWSTTQGFTGVGAAFLPFAFIPAVKMVQNPRNPIQPLLFGGVIALLLSIHVFTAFLAVIAIIPFFCIGFYRAKNKIVMLINAMLAVIIAICLSMNTFVAMLEVQSNTLIMPLVARDLYGGGTFLSTGAMDYNNFGLILSTLFLIQLVVTISQWKELTTLEKVINVTGLLFLIVSSKYFPWNHLTDWFPSLLSIQFLRRLAAIPLVLLVLGFGITIDRGIQMVRNIHFKKASLISLSVIALLSATNGWQLIENQARRWNSSEPLSGDTRAAEILEDDENKVRAALSDSDLSKAFTVSQKPTSDYLPTNTNLQNGYSAYSKEILHNDLTLSKEVTPNSELKLTWDSNQSDDENILLPVIIYNNSYVELNGKMLSSEEYSLSEIGSLILPNNHQENTVIVGYNPSTLFSFSLFIKFISMALLLMYLLYQILKKMKKTSKQKNKRTRR